MRVAVIGAGASGVVSAIYAKNKGDDVVIFERNSSPLKKLLITGNGKCNYFNSDQDIIHYHSTTGDVSEIITKDNFDEVIKFFDSLGIVPKIKNGYYYPYSGTSNAIKEALLLECDLLGIEIVTDYFVSSVSKVGSEFIINDELSFDKVIVATGSKAYPKTGSDGNGYDIVRSFGHTVTPVLPSLTGLVTSERLDLDGVRCDATVSLYEDDKFVKSETGELQFTKDGISGICVFNLSGYVSSGLFSGKKEEVSINFVNWCDSIDSVLTFLEFRSLKVTGRKVLQFLEGFIHYKIVKVILKRTGISEECYFDELNKKEKYALAKCLFAFKVNIKATNSFDKAQTCGGGIPLNEVDIHSMQSKLVSGLYFTGELLDVYGDCGGYNLTFAFITGILSGRN